MNKYKIVISSYLAYTSAQKCTVIKITVAPPPKWYQSLRREDPGKKVKTLKK